MYWPNLQHSRLATHVGDTPGADYYVDLGAPGASNTKSTWKQLFAATPFDACCVMVEVQVPINAFLYFDLAIGSPETVILPNILVTRSASGATADATQNVTIPVVIPKGTPVSVRYQHHTGGTAKMRFKLRLLAAGFLAEAAPTVWEDWGTNTATTIGTSVTTGAINVKGAWVTLKTATGFDVRWVMASMQSMESSRHLTFDIGVGLAGSEQVVIPDLQFTNQQNGDLFGPIPLEIPKGTRIAARAAAGTAGSVPRIAAYGGGR